MRCQGEGWIRAGWGAEGGTVTVAVNQGRRAALIDDGSSFRSFLLAAASRR